MKNKNVAIAIIINIFITVSEAVIGLLIGSFALVSDAVHNFSDARSLVFSWRGEKVKEKGSAKFGMRRSLSR